MKVELILSIVLAFATVCYTVINLFILIESKKTRNQKITPQIVPFLKVSDSKEVLELHIKNIGDGIGKDVDIDVIEDMILFNDKRFLFSNLGVFVNGMKNFPPEYELIYYITWMNDIEGYKEKQIWLKVKYRRQDKKQYEEEFIIPFKEVLGPGKLEPPETYIGQISYYSKAISNSLKNIEKNIKK